MALQCDPVVAAVSEDSALLALREAVKSYVDGSLSVPALRGVNLDVQPECFTMLVGPSGCGKTTLLNVAGGIDTLDSGSVQIAGQRLDAMDDAELTRFRARHLGFIFQSFSLVPVMSAYENVEYGLVCAGQGNDPGRRRQVEEVLDAVGLASHARHRPQQLSGGQRQRVAIARALVKRPTLVLADEPTANLDSETGAAIIALMRHMQREYKTTFLFSTHDQALMRHADRILHMRDGRVEHSEQLLQRSAT